LLAGNLYWKKVIIDYMGNNSASWNAPQQLDQFLSDNGGIWEDECLDPLRIVLMSGTSYAGRDIPLAWQVEFEPSDEQFEASNEKLRSLGIEPDGDGWTSVIENEFKKRHPNLVAEFHSDSESSTCVLWVESETACKKLIEIIWPFIDTQSNS
jgi:hypothetical protein